MSKPVIRARSPKRVITLNPQRKPASRGERLTIPEGATIAGYALEVGGVLVDGVAAGEERARIIYERREQSVSTQAWWNTSREQLPHAL